MKTEYSVDVHEVVREHYGKVARTDGACGCGTGCCDATVNPSTALGYGETELAGLPAGADMGLGCGTPLAFAGIREGDTVLDLGSGGGIDCFLAAKQVGASGRVIGVDMTADMIAKARRNAATVSAANVEFRLGEIEHLPLPARTVDLIVSNCVINLSPDKPAVFREAFRVLKPGGRLAIADIVTSAPLPAEIKNDPEALAGCIAGAPAVGDVEAALRAAGFTDISVEINAASRSFIKGWNPGSGAENFVASAAIRATRPAGDACCGGTATAASCC